MKMRGPEEDMRVLVTGSSGFLGRHVAEHLVSQAGYEVTGFDLRPGQLGGLPTTEGDLCDLDAVIRATRGMEVVVHFGGIGDVDVATERPELAAKANIVGSANVAIAARKTGARVVYASTWEVYGPPLYQPVDERHVCDPGNVYAATKLSGELMLRAAHRSDGLPVVILRLGTAYGLGMRPNSVFSRFCDAARTGQPIVVHGTGSQSRQFTHASDIVRAVQLGVESGQDDLTVNIVSQEQVTIRELAEMVSSRCGVPVKFGRTRPGDPHSARISSADATRILGWSAEVDFVVGLSELLVNFDARSLPETAERGR
jgi:nucleoside-diphosphate-sugar epimerase